MSIYNSDRDSWPSRAELAREEAEDRLDACLESGKHAAVLDDNENGDLYCHNCGWAVDPDEPTAATDEPPLGAAA